MDMEPLWYLIPSFFLIALLYASVGHGGASGYLAALSLFGFQPEEMATTALTLNLFVAGLALVSFVQAGHFIARLAWPFALASLPAAFLGGLATLSNRVYSWCLAVALLAACFRLVKGFHGREEVRPKIPGLAIALPIGAAIGLFSGVVGIGGGVFLSPLLLLCGFANPKQTSASSAVFIVVNSAAALLGRFARHGLQYGILWPLLLAACAGGFVGSRLGANHFSGSTLKRLLAVALLIAAVKAVIA